MIITVNSGSGNLADYLINGINKKRDKEKVFILDGDLNLSKKISENTKYKDKHFHIIVSLKNKYDNESASKIYNDFKKELLNAYREDEVNISAVLHQDTNNTHFHCMIPKQNLLTNTKLNLYFDNSDRKRFELIRDYLDTKYNLESPTIKNLKPIDKTNAITKNWKIDTNTIKTKKDKSQFEQELLNQINSNLHHFKTHTELLDYLKENITIEKFGYDYKNDKFYATIKHQSGTNQRVFSPLFNSGDLKYTLNENNEKVYEKFDFENFLYSKKEVDFSSNKLLKLREKLDIENEKYKTHIENRLSKSRQKALNKLNNISISNEDKKISITSNITENKYPTFISQSKEFFEDLENINKSDISKIATHFFNYKEIQREDNFSIIQNEKSNDLLLIFKDKKHNYKFLNPLTKMTGDGIDFLLNAFYVPILTPHILNPIRKFIKDLKSAMGIISEVVLSEIIEALSKKLDVKKAVEKDIKSSFTPLFNLSPSRDLKPY
jgi:hypothetical protein